ILPYSHVLERVNGVLVELMGGGTIWLSRGHDKVAEDLLVCQPTVLIAIPSLYEKLYQALKVHLKQRPFQQRAIFHLAYQAGARRAAGSPSRLYPLADRLILKPLRQRLVGNRMRCLIVGGASLSTKVEEFFWAVGLPILQGWGMTETSSAATANTESEHRVGSVGQPLPAVELRIAEDGEIWVKGPGNMLGYFHNEAITTETVTGEWMKTGDIGYLDDDGFLYLTDRKKELIKTAGGKYVAPQQLESRLQQQSLIDRAVVIGDQRPYITALLVPNWDVVSKELGLTGNPTELVHEGRLRVALQGCINRLNSELERWETIKRFTLLPAKLSEAKGELTPTLKLRRKVIIERYKSLVNQIYERKDGGGE
ncbi:MAG: AMP-dependent synthetase/ligase, partial [Candidatus Dormibacteraceae bacterium]